LSYVPKICKRQDERILWNAE